jgi:short-subunit dehydrogenase
MTALITGASSGIGLELARIAARESHQVVLVARSQDRLADLARELNATYHVTAEIIAADLSRAHAAETVAGRVAALGYQVDILVNNAGFGLYGPFAETPLETELDMIQVNIVALTELTKRLLPPMLARRSGRILNVASTAAFFPGPLMSVYYATKAYVLSFSEAIGNELSASGITVTALCPGPTTSGFQAAAKLEESRLVSGKMLMGSREVAEAGWKGMMGGDAVVIPGASNRMMVQLPRLFPRRAITKMVRTAQERR